MRLTFLGTGTSFGVPMIGCRCRVCRSADPKDKRLRPSVLVSHGPARILVDAPPDLRAQCLARNISRVDAILVTHVHADHIFGLDDIRQFNRAHGPAIDVHASPDDCGHIRQTFAYAFQPPRKPGVTLPKMRLDSSGSFDVRGISVEAFDVEHGASTARGYLFSWGRGRRLAYLPDCKSLPPAVVERLRGVDALILDALRWRRPHPTHMLIPDSIAAAARISPAITFLTHMNHHAGLHAETQALLPKGVFLAYDGLTLAFDRRLPRILP